MLFLSEEFVFENKWFLKSSLSDFELFSRSKLFLRSSLSVRSGF